MDLFDLTGKVAVVSGGGRGIGMMMARGLLQAGASVYISSRKAEAGQAAVAELSQYGVVLSVPADLAREEECLRLAEEVGRFEERVHILVNNAGTNWGAPLAEFPASAWDPWRLRRNARRHRSASAKRSSSIAGMAISIWPSR